jgi:hypothetical protein
MTPKIDDQATMSGIRQAQALMVRRATIRILETMAATA